MSFFLRSPKFRNALFVGISSLAALSCEKDAGLTTSPTDAAAYAVTEAQATTAAENIALSAGVAAQRRRSQQTGDTQRVFQGRQRLLNLTAVPAADGKPGLYFCNYAQGGFAIIAADRHMQPVLAFAEHGTLPTGSLAGARAVPEGMASWLETTRQVAAALRQNPGEQNSAPGAGAAWQALVDKPGDLAKTFFTPASPSTRVLPDDTPPTDPPPVQVGPLMQTTWGQGCGYNDYVTSSNEGGDYCYHCPTGCVATAQAQVMYYWKAPAYFDWTSMALSYGTPATAHLMDDLGGKLHMDYNPTTSPKGGSGADPDYIDDAFKNNYGYRSADYISNEDPGLYQTVVSNLNNRMPVILSGSPSVNWFGYPNAPGHCWACDGYIQSYYQGNGYLQFYMNWGWNGYYNGWFAYNNWQVRDAAGNLHNFNYAKTYTVNIHP